VGPGYSIAHPGMFPHHVRNDPKSDNFISIKDWMSFDWRSGWGTNAFEQNSPSSDSFPEEWRDPQRRAIAASIVRENIEKLEARQIRRKGIMEIGSRLDGPFFESTRKAGEPLEFAYKVTNIDKGHNLPSGSLGAQPEIWLNVALIDPNGRNVWESGYLDSHGDMADLHSKDVLAGTLAHDDQLFNLQTKFLTTNLKGTDREMYLPVPFDGDQLPFIRPPGQPVTVMNHPPFIRMEQRSIPPLGYKMAEYEVPAELMTQPGTYKLAVRLRSRAEPIYFMEFVFATQEMIRDMNRRIMDFHEYTVEFEVQ
ncbi:MAG: cytochrome C, partial [Planctomycetota bacterium]